MVPFWGTLNIRCCIILRTQKGTIILTTTHVSRCNKEALSCSAGSLVASLKGSKLHIMLHVCRCLLTPTYIWEFLKIGDPDMVFRVGSLLKGPQSKVPPILANTHIDSNQSLCLSYVCAATHGVQNSGLEAHGRQGPLIVQYFLHYI